jgi:phage terminase large subunit
VAYGGRGSGKTTSFGLALLIIAMQDCKRFLCTREIQKSIKQSVHKLLGDLIQGYELPGFTIKNESIKHLNGSEFVFAGIKSNIESIKSMEGIDYCWVEEAAKVSKNSWDVLIPTIRKEGSEIWITYNPDLETDETHQRFVVNPNPASNVQLVNYDDNPFFPEVLRKEMEYDRSVDFEKYEHVWLGKCASKTDAQIFRNKYEVTDFETPDLSKVYENRFFYGADWGFSQDPTTLNRSFIMDKRLYIDYEAYGVGVELDEIPQLFDSVPEARKWPIKADCSRPETISHVKGKGFNISAAKKWQGSVEDGIEYLRSFEKIVVHPRCKHTIDEMKFYCYKVDKNTGEILPIIVDKHNHCIDGIRYSLDGYIKKEANIFEVW